MEENEVLAFISYLNTEIKERPQCMMVAMMLKLKFDGAQIKYRTGHFITLIDKQYYDWDGVVSDVKDFTEFPKEWGDSHIVNHYFAVKKVMRRN